eukprot:CAMPEP_0113695960 /NCGR_PEP_ID=MMETSP0038_2-20120614/21207_1 /TAXON_ID=2898 /ORGANISM="Cryptomonas paramecium" /LENGTH=38 /DNA_ID=CAMNT_0000618595 /DNA_START=146 /DNA_END=258 /DNA_ORIENTATION=- /assembly_acc=CAM_ASM_000170
MPAYLENQLFDTVLRQFFPDQSKELTLPDFAFLYYAVL